jgi:4-carboxymuconolactone decarboxylase
MPISKRPLADEPSRTAKRPRSWQQFSKHYPSVVSAYDTFSEACRSAGPLDELSVALAKVAVSVGGGIERTVHAHAKKALRAGVAPDALRQVALIALPTIGLPAALDALRWIDESVCEEGLPHSHPWR